VREGLLRLGRIGRTSHVVLVVLVHEHVPRLSRIGRTRHVTQGVLSCGPSAVLHITVLIIVKMEHPLVSKVGS
jgi:hypothetical protein